MKKLFSRAAALGVSVVLAACTLAGCGSSSAKVDGTQPLITMGDEVLTLGSGSFYARFQQAQVYKYWGAYFGTTGLFDTIEDSSTGETYADAMKQSVIEELEQMMVLRAHASDYDVALTDEQESAIDEAAQAYIDGNTQEVLDLVGASKEDVKDLLALQTIQSLMMDPMTADVDTDIPDEEVQQTSLSYVTVSVTDDGDDETDDAAAAKETAEKVLEAVLSSENGDMDEAAKTVDESLTASTGTFTTNDTEDTYLDAEVVGAVKDLTDGTVVDHVVESEDGNSFYIVRLDKVFDEDATESERTSAIRDRKQDHYDELLDGWVGETEFTVNEDAWKNVVVSDSAPVTLKDPASESEEEAAEEIETAEEDAEAEADGTASETEEAAEEEEDTDSSASDAE